ncbi:hypothetical protein GCM10027451_17680 [Geodermatophilus aquaeductus]|uniref:Intein C-terminal splicing region/intein N-terminal splicing region n=1 Tax=Geodermatophilus aquaeductus TaxID=1564161 RepID=A0A521E2Y7_9ACTN|nr:Rv2578c family radical SAM protein [Geodermatophilus aquaeductus]SMO78272.1 intein C-terminal splicing region/intein N-terminal splicing region [Geodermatophilus aquaeductus]
MRWDAQRLDADDESLLPGMPSLRGLLRSVEVPEFPGVTMHEVLCRSALNPVPEGSRMPFSHTINPYRGCLHQCVYCVAGDTRILMADGSQRPISDLRVGDRIVGTERRGTYRHYVPTEVLAHWGTVKPAHRVTLADGTELVASGDHRFLATGGWAYVTPSPAGPSLTTGDRLLGCGQSGAVPVVGAAVTGDAALEVADLQALGLEMPMFDITTGTGDFVANGVISHNCFARSTHEWLDLDAGRDFDTQIVVKTNLVEVLRRELARPSAKRRHVALGTNTDPYQRAEGRYRLMPGVIRALADSGTPFSILTKGTLARRDLPLLADAARDVPVGFGVSLAIWDDDLHASLEPGVPSPRARLDLVRAVTDAGLPCGVFLAPVLPGLTDRQSDLDAALGAIAEAGATGVTVVPLHLRPGAREWFSAWLAREHPSLVGRYRQLYRGGAYVPAEYRAWLAERVTPLLRRHGLDGRSGGAARGAEAPSGVPGDDEAAFPAGSLPPARDAATDRPRGARSRRARADDVPGQLALV